METLNSLTIHMLIGSYRMMRRDLRETEATKAIELLIWGRLGLLFLKQVADQSICQLILPTLIANGHRRERPVLLMLTRSLEGEAE